MAFEELAERTKSDESSQKDSQGSRSPLWVRIIGPGNENMGTTKKIIRKSKRILDFIFGSKGMTNGKK